MGDARSRVTTTDGIGAAAAGPVAAVATAPDSEAVVSGGASVLMIFLGLGLVWAALRHSPPNLGALGTAAVILVISVRSLVSTVLELRSRKS